MEDLADAIAALDDYKITLLFESDAATDPLEPTHFAKHHYLTALAQIENAIQSLRLADMWLTRELGDMRKC
tara:strand:- start:1234 stop:1446 length:213 start_codon:yes stop_codon:yes gene_type:complete